MLWLLIIFCYINFSIVPVVGGNFSEVPFNETEWYSTDDEVGPIISKKLVFNTSKTNYTIENYFYIPFRNECRKWYYV